MNASHPNDNSGHGQREFGQNPVRGVTQQFADMAVGRETRCSPRSQHFGKTSGRTTQNRAGKAFRD
jgi:hypothetical protein